MPDVSPKINYDRVDFPSDHLTLKQLRSLATKAHGPLGAGAIEDYLDDNAEGLAIMHSIEQMFADLGFARASGNQELIRAAGLKFTSLYGTADLNDATQQVTSELSHWYERFGIAGGLETTRQAVRRLEDSAHQVANEMLGRTGGAGS